MLDATTARRAHAGARATTILPPFADLESPIISAGPLSPALALAVARHVPSAIAADDVGATVRPGSRPTVAQKAMVAERRSRQRSADIAPTKWELLRASLTSSCGDDLHDCPVAVSRPVTGAAFAYLTARLALQNARALRFAGDVAASRGAGGVALARYQKAGQEVARARRWRDRARRARVAAQIGGAS